LAEQRLRTLHDIDNRMAEHLATFSSTLAGGMQATEAGARQQPAARPATTAGRSLPAARVSLPTTRLAFHTTSSGIPRIYPPSHNFPLGNPVATSMPAQQSANTAAGRASSGGSSETPITVPSSSDEEVSDKNRKGKKDGDRE
jgi:hypothetical protein